MNEKPLTYAVKSPVSLTVDVKSNFHSGCKVVDVTFPSIVNPEAPEDLESVGEICFKNHYVAFVTVKARSRQTQEMARETNDHGWRMVIKRFRLMPDPHTELGAQDSFSLTRKLFQCDVTNVTCLRFILQQPSPVWKDFKLDEIKMFRSPRVMQAPSFLPALLTDNVNEMSGKKQLEGAPDLNMLSSSLQQLWALAEEAASNQTEEPIGRYDVDGCYDINLLSYS